MRRVVLFGVLACFWGPGQPGVADGAEPGAGATEARDAAFDVLVDMQLVTQAIDAADPQLLADAGALLCRAEETLGRPHRANLQGAVLLEKALLLASSRQDQPLLDRLESLAGVYHQDNLATRIRALKKVAAGTRSAEAEVPVDALTIEEFVVYRGQLQAIRRAALVGDAGRIEQLAQQIAAEPPPNELCRRQLTEALEFGRRAAAQVTPETAAPLARLAAGSRGGTFVTEVAEANARLAEAQVKLIQAMAQAVIDDHAALRNIAETRKSSAEAVEMELRTTAQTAALLARLAAGSRGDAPRDHAAMAADLAEAQAKIMQAAAQGVIADGDWRKKVAEARKVSAEAVEMEIRNTVTYAEAFWTKRRLWEENQRKRRVWSREQLERLTSYTPPTLPSSPYLLTQPPFTEDHTRLVALLRDWSPENSGLGSQNCFEIKRVVARLQLLLKQRLADYHPQEYVQAQKFLSALDYYVSLPAGRRPTSADEFRLAVYSASVRAAATTARTRVPDPDPAAGPPSALDAPAVASSPDDSLGELRRAWQEFLPRTVAVAAARLLKSKQEVRLPKGQSLAHEVFRIAVRLAALSGEASLAENLAKTATEAGQAALAEEAAKVREGMGDARPGAPAGTVNPDAVPLQAIQLFQAYLADMRAGRLAGNRTLLAALVKSLDSAPLLSAQQKEHLRRVGTPPPGDAGRAITIDAAIWQLLEPNPGERTVAVLEQLLTRSPSLATQLDHELTGRAAPGVPLTSVAAAVQELYGVL